MARILQVCNTDFYLRQFLTPLVRALVDEGHSVDCVCEGTQVDVDALGSGVVIHSFEFPRTNSLTRFVAAIHRMRRIIERGRYDCVDSHNRNASIVARVAAFLEHVPVNLYTAHGFYFHDDQSPLTHFATVGLEAVLARVTDFTLSQSTEDVTFMTERGYVLSHRIEPIGNGIDTRRFRPALVDRRATEVELGLRSERFRIATTGRLVRGKGFGDLLRAFGALHQRTKDAELLIIGGNIEQDISPYQAAFLAEAKTLGLDGALVVTGITSKVPEYLATADVFVLPSYREGMPRSLIEAMSMELPVVATNIRGCREVVVDGESGLLFEPHDVARLEDRLAFLYDSKERRATLGANARKRAVDCFDEAGYVSRQQSAIRRLVGAPGEVS